MTVSIQPPTVSMTEISLFSLETQDIDQEESIDFQNSEKTLQEEKTDLKDPLKKYSTTFNQKIPLFAQKTREYVQMSTPLFSAKLNLSEAKTFFTLPSPSSYHPSLYSFLEQTKMPQLPQKEKPCTKEHQEKIDSPIKESHQTDIPQPKTVLQKQHDPKTLSSLGHHNKTSIAKENAGQSVKSLHHQKSEKKEEHASLQLNSREWTKEETKSWWEKRYTQKERQGGNQQGQDQEKHEKEEKKLRISKSASISTKNQSCDHSPQQNAASKIKKPELAPPKLGVIALYYILTKLGILSDGVSNFGYKKEIERVDVETNEAHKKRLEEIKEGIKKEKETERWGVAVKVFSWIASLLGIITGIVLIATGIGAVAGAMLMAGGTIQIANQIMELAGGWQKIANLLPGEDSDKKGEVIRWMQIGIAVLCLILSGAGILFGGFSNFGEAMQTATSVMAGIASMGYGITTIGEGISNFLYKDRLSQVKKFDIRLAQLKHMRLDLMGKVSSGMDRLEKLFEDLARALEFEEELFQADQMIHRR